MKAWLRAGHRNTGRHMLAALLAGQLVLGSMPAGLLAQDEEQPPSPEPTKTESPAPTPAAGDAPSSDIPTLKPKPTPPPPPKMEPKAGAAEATGAPKATAAPTALITSVGSDKKIELALNDISDQAGVTVTPYGKAPGARVNLMKQDATVEDVLNTIASQLNFVWWRLEDGSYGIADREYYERNVLPTKVKQKTFQPNNIKASELDKAIKGLITQNVGSSVADDRTNKLIVTDLPQALERIERFIREIDVQLVVRVFYIRHADVDDVAKKIEGYKSGPGTIEVDTKTHQIIVTDLLSNVKKMELLIDILDVGPEIVIYDVNNIGIEGEDLEDLKAIIDSIRTKDLLFEVKAKQGVFILEDVPEVHERVEQILEGFDKPAKQVLIQGEILSTSFNRQLNYGLQRAAWSQDLLAASSRGALPGLDAGLGNPLGTTTGTAAPVNYTDMNNLFPNALYSGGKVTGNYLSKEVLLQYQAAYQETSTRVLLQPRLLVKNQQSSKIFVGREVPYLTTFTDTSNNNNNDNFNRTSTQQTVTDGLTFDVTPSISNSYLVELDLQIDNDVATPQTITDAGVDRRVVGRDRQQVETILQIPSGESRVIGGLISANRSEGSTGLPFLVSLPYVGALFGNKSNEKTSSNLMIFITPTIVEDVLPRPTTKDGRRGRLVTDYERVPGAMDLGENKLENDDATEPDAAALSGSAAEEEKELDALDEARRKNSGVGDSNYVPTAGTGSATINTGGGTTPSAGSSQQGGAGKPVAPERIRPRRDPAIPDAGTKPSGGTAEPVAPATGNPGNSTGETTYR